MSLRFLRYARPAVAAAISRSEGDPQARIRATVNPQLELQTIGDDGNITTWVAAGATLAVLGPADLVALAPDQILARVPAPDASAVSPGLFASVEFVRPDLPWLFTPFAPGANDTLKPWLCLVVLPAADAKLDQGPHGTVVRLDAAASGKLPPLTQAMDWAHVQEGGARNGDDRNAVSNGASEVPRRFRSRLLCPTVLLSDTDYLACLVPTFLGGRKAGMGDDIDLTDRALLEPAWNVGQPVELPIYDHWRFSTGAANRFADLVDRLAPYDPASAPGRQMDAGAPEGSGGAVFANAYLALDAVMGPRNPEALPTPPAALVGHLSARLADPSPLAPSVYGGRHARATLPLSPQAPAWVRALNLDPVRRAIAGLGAEVVRRHQEEMMAAIWEQAGEIERANQLLRIGQAARAASTALFQRRVAPDLLRGRDGLDLGALLWMAPMLGHLPVAPNGLTARTELERSCLPNLATSGAFRKLLRPNGPVMRRLRRRRDGQSAVSDLLLRLADGGGRRPSQNSSSATTLTAAELAAVGTRPFNPQLRVSGGRIAPVSINPIVVRGQPTSVAPASMEGAKMLAGRLAQPRSAVCRPMGVIGGGEREILFEALRDAADPSRTIPRRTRARIDADPASPALSTPTDDALDPILLAPKLPWPMLRPLLALGRDWMAPALEARGTPEDYIALMEANPAFIESYLAGLNEEIGREMLWRGFPTDQRGTVFDRFWSEQRAEWPDLHTWTGTLGAHGLPGTSPRMVVAVRGALLQHFDRTRVFLQKASAARPPEPLPLGDPQSTLYPLIETRLPGGIACFGFDLTPEAVVGGGGHGPGWYLVFQEPPVDLRFGPVPSARPGSHAAGSGASDLFAETALRPQQRVFIHASRLLGRI